jgi:hypothetical protein
LTNILRLGWGGISCPFMTSHGLSLREAPWSAVAAATAFLALALARLRDESMAEGGSCYRTPRLKGAYIELGPTKDARLRLRRPALQAGWMGLAPPAHKRGSVISRGGLPRGSSVLARCGRSPCRSSTG